MSFDNLRRRIERIEREAAPERDRMRRLIELLAVGQLRKGGRGVDVRDLALWPESELLSVIGARSREEVRAALPDVRDLLRLQKEKRGLEP